MALLAVLLTSLWSTPGATASWSAPARPPGCAAVLTAAAMPLIVFPTSAPTVGSGPGALLWTAPRGCAVDATAGEAVAATLGADVRPGHANALSGNAVAAAAGTTTGQVVKVARGAAASSYLGDVAVASPVRTHRGWAIAVRTQRHYENTLGAPRLVAVGRHPIVALAVTLDFRAEALLVWASGGAIYACELPQSGPAHPVHRLAELEAGARTSEVRALLSDDGHAIVAWRSQSSSGAPTTTLALSISGAALAWAPPHTLERYRDPSGFVPPAGALRLVRLSSEAVMLAWTGVREGRYVVLSSPVSLRRGAWAPVALSQSAPADEAILSDIAPGPDAEAVAVWRVAPRLPGSGRVGSGRVGSIAWAIRAARGHYAGRGEVSFDAPEQVAPPGANGPPAVAIDPASGSALAAWVSLACAPHIEYAVRTTESTPAIPAVTTGGRDVRGGGDGGGWIVPVVAAALALALALLFAAARRPRRLRAGRGL